MTNQEAHAAYDEMLDEVYGDAEVCGYTYSSSRALKELDPIAYDCGFNDWCDSEGIDTNELED